MTNKAQLLLAPLLASACVTAPDPETTDPAADEAPGEAAAIQEINGDASAASQYMLDRAVAIPGCTATRIARDWAITAMHCSPDVGDTVNFYTTGPGMSGSTVARIAEVRYRPGASPGSCCDDSNGDFADVALIRLTNHPNRADVPDGHIATLAWAYPGEDKWGKKVGAGAHDGNANPSRVLLQVSDTLDSPSDSGGYFTTTDDNTQGGDSGGPFYYDSKILGTLKGSGWDPWDGEWNKYTSVPFHLGWILSTIGYRWGGAPPRASTIYTGTSLETFLGSERECQYACERTSACEAYNYNPLLQTCQLVDGVGGYSSSSAFRGALRHGHSSGVSNEIVGYVRSDGYNAVVHTASNGHVHELYLQGGAWKVGDISNGNPPPPASKLSAYVRADGTNAVVYRSTTNRIIELALVGGLFTAYDLSAWGGATPAGSPVAYVRGDGASAVVYRGTDGKIHELRLATTGWIATDLTAAAGSAVTASSDPSAFVRSDGYSSVVFRSGSTIYELYKGSKGDWAIGAPSSLAPGAPAAAGRPYGYTHADGINAIVYRSTAGQIVELWLDGAGWHAGALPNATGAAGDPVAYVRADALESVLYRSTSSQILEAVNAPWATWNLSAIAGAGTSSTNPAVYIRRDGYHAVLFGLPGNHVGEMYWQPGGPSWAASDLTVLANETP